MAEYTPNLALKKPSNSDYVRISDNNENMDVLDADIKALQDAIEELESVEVINDLNHTDADKALSANQGKVLDDKISTLTGRIANGEKTAAYEAKRLDNLIKLTQGKVFDYQTDATEAYSKAVPLGSQQYGSLDMVGGKSLVFNQLQEFKNKTDRTVNGVALTFENGVANAVGVCTSNITTQMICGDVKIVNGHRYYMSGINGGSLTVCKLQLWDKVASKSLKEIADGSIVYQAVSDTTGYMRIVIYKDADINTKFSPQLIDLTKMFGEGNEPTLEQCREIFSADYYPYNAGELMNFGVNEVESKGSNLLDPNARTGTHYNPNVGDTLSVGEPSGTWTFKNDALKLVTTAGWQGASFVFPVESGQTYQFGGTLTLSTPANYRASFIQIDENRVVLSKKNYTNSTAAGTVIPNYFVASETAKYFCISLATSASGDTLIWENPSVVKSTTAVPYSPYGSKFFAIPQSILDLPDYGASAGSVYNYIDFDRKVYVQNVGGVDLGTLNWSYDASYQRMRVLRKDFADTKPTTRRTLLACAKYTAIMNGEPLDSGWDNVVYVANDLCVHDHAYTSASEFKTAMNGIMLYYELKTPIETDISDLIDNGLIFAEGGGTITFKNVKGDEYHIPVPNKETYMVKLADSI